LLGYTEAECLGRPAAGILSGDVPLQDNADPLPRPRRSPKVAQ
jgi:hypothetical protein